MAYKVKTVKKMPTLLRKLQLGVTDVLIEVETKEDLEWALQNGVPFSSLVVEKEELIKSLPTSTLRKLIREGPEPSRLAALMEIDDKQLLMEFLKRNEWKYVIRNPHLGGDAIDILPSQIRYYLGEVRSPELLRAIFEKYGESRKIAQNPHTPADVLLAFKDRTEVIENPNFPASEVLKMESIPLQFFGREDVPVEVFVQAWDKIDIDHEMSFYEKSVLGGYSFFSTIGSNASLALIERGEFVDKLARYSPYPEVLQKLFDLKGEQVAGKLLQNKRCPVSLLAKLLHAEDPKVRKRARRRLLEKKLKEFEPYVGEILEFLGKQF